jgi:nucleotide-binding universal stress UspA family protein
MFQRLLICTDLNDGLQQLARCVNSFAATGVQHITFLHSQPIADTLGVPKIDATAVTQVKAAIERWLPAQPKLSIAIEVQMGRIGDCITRTAEQSAADLILLGTASKTNFNEKLFGSTTLELAKKTTRPLLILRPQLINVMMVEELQVRCQYLFQRLLIPYNNSPAANYLIGQIQRLNQPQPQVERCILCWISPDRNWLSIPEAEQAAQIDQQLIPAETQLQQTGIKTQRAIHQGNALQGILATARETDVSAIAIASNNLGTIAEWSTPSLTSELIRQSWHPLLFFPQPK